MSSPTSGRRGAGSLDDEADREELRRRYDMLLQELRVLLPGDQLLVAFLLTAPFAQGFGQVDSFGRLLYGVALTCGLLSIVAFTTPIAFHRFGDRDERSIRLVWGIWASRLGVVLLGASLVGAFAVIVRVVYGGAVAVMMIVAVSVVLMSCWLALPQLTRRPARARRSPQSGSDDAWSGGA